MTANRDVLSNPEARRYKRWPRGEGKLNWPKDFRKFMAWGFLVNAIAFVQQTIRLLRIQQFALMSWRVVLGGPTFSAVVAVVCAMAWWNIWKETRWAKSWGIAASLTFIAMFIRPFIIPLGLRPGWGDIGAILIAVVGLYVFLLGGFGINPESAS